MQSRRVIVLQEWKIGLLFAAPSACSIPSELTLFFF